VSRRRGQHSAAAAPPPAMDAATSQVIVLANAMLANARGNRRAAADPVLGFSTEADYSQGGTVSGLTPELLASYLNEWYAGTFANIARVWEVFERRDDACAVGRMKLRRKVMRQLRGYQILPFDDSPAAERQAEYLRAFYRRLHGRSAIDKHDRGGLRKIVWYLLDAIGKQYSLLARSWDGAGEDLTLTLSHVPLWFFQRRYGELEYTGGTVGAVEAEPIDPEQWAIACTGEAVMEPAGVTCLLKRMPLHQLVHIMEKWGEPVVYGRTQNEKDSPGWVALMSALQAIVGGWAGIITGADEISEIERKLDNANLHEPWIDRCDRVISTLWLGSHLGTKAEGDTGTLAGGAQADDTSDVIGDVCEWLTETLRTEVDTPALLYGLGVDEPLAGFSVSLPDAEDDQGDADRLERFAKLGMPIPISHIRTRFDIPEPEGDEPILTAPAPSSPFGGGGGPPPFGNRASSSTAAAATPAGSAPPKQAPPSAHALLANAAAAVGFRDRRSDLDELAANSLQPVGAAYARLVQDLLDQIETAPNLARAADIASAWRADAAARERFAQIMTEVVFAAAMMGFEPCRDGIPAATIDERAAAESAESAPAPVRGIRNTIARAVARIAGRRGAQTATLENAEARYEPLPFDEARAFWSAKRLIADFADLEQLDMTWLEARTLGFKVAGITEEAVLRQVHRDIESAIRGEVSVSKLTRTLRDKYGLGSYHAETVARTNIQSAYQWGHYQQMQAVTATFPIWAFDVVDDENTSDICYPLLGLAYPANHPIWDSLYPPNHFRCRTTVVPLDTAEAAEQGFTVSDRWPRNPDNLSEFMPQPGFEGNIGTVPLGDLLDRADIANSAIAVLANFDPGQPRDEEGKFANTKKVRKGVCRHEGSDTPTVLGPVHARRAGVRQCRWWRD